MWNKSINEQCFLSRPDCSEEESFQWMSRVLQAVDSIHQVGIYCLALVPPNHLPKTPLGLYRLHTQHRFVLRKSSTLPSSCIGGIHLCEARRRFLEGSLHPANVLMCPHTCVTNLPKPRELHHGNSFTFQTKRRKKFSLFVSQSHTVYKVEEKLF